MTIDWECRFPLLWAGVRWQAWVWRFRVHKQIIFGDDGWLFNNDGGSGPPIRMTDLRGRLRMTTSKIARIEQQLNLVRVSFAACGRPAFVFVAPNKQSIYPEKILTHLKDYPTTRFDDLLANIGPAARSIIIDPRSRLRSNKQAYGGALYTRTDTHWNGVGAYISYREIVETLARQNAIEFPERAASTLFRTSTSSFEGGDIQNRILYSPSEHDDVYMDMKAEDDLPIDVEQVSPDHLRFTNPNGRRKLLMQGDSFSPSLAPLLARHFHEVELLMAPSFPLVFDGLLLARHQGDVALIEIVERNLLTLLEAPRHLDQVCADNK